jgi:hypothetical protein
MIPFKIGTKEIELPTTHGEMTLRQFLVYKNEKEPTFESLLSLFAGLEKDEIYSCSDIDLDHKIWPYLEWVTKPCDYIFPMPVLVSIGKKNYRIPSVYESTYGQKVIFSGIFDKALVDGQDWFSLYPEILTLYFYPLLKGKFSENYNKDQYINDLILDMRIEEALPVASFFLTSFQQYAKLKPSNYHTTPHRKKGKRVFPSLISLAVFKPFIALRKTLINLLMKCYRWIITRSSRSYFMKQRVPDSSVN